MLEDAKVTVHGESDRHLGGNLGLYSWDPTICNNPVMVALSVTWAFVHGYSRGYICRFSQRAPTHEF